jgi:hypothetical protein
VIGSLKRASWHEKNQKIGLLLRVNFPKKIIVYIKWQSDPIHSAASGTATSPGVAWASVANLTISALFF